MRNNTGMLITDDTPRYTPTKRFGARTKGDPADICIQLKARHFVTCPANDTEFVCVEDDCYGCGCYDCINSTEHTVHCNGIFSKWDQDHLHLCKEKIIADWVKSAGDVN